MAIGPRRRSQRAVPLVALAVLFGCATPPTQAPLGVLNVFATSAAYPWLDRVYVCAPASAAVRLSDPSSADIELRLGQPDRLRSPAFQVGSADMLVVVHPRNGVASLTLDQVQALFAGQVTNWRDIGGSTVPVLVWTYSSAEDVQEYFDRAVMDGRPVTSLARLAVSAQVMSDSVGAVPGSIGFLPLRWKTGSTSEVLALPSIPVLATVKAEPQGIVRDLLSCMQSSDAGAP
jgi:hypothetical protein